MCHIREEIEKEEEKNNDGGVNTKPQWVGGETGVGWRSVTPTGAPSGSFTAVPSAASSPTKPNDNNNKTVESGWSCNTNSARRIQGE